MSQPRPLPQPSNGFLQLIICALMLPSPPPLMFPHTGRTAPDAYPYLCANHTPLYVCTSQTNVKLTSATPELTRLCHIYTKANIPDIWWVLTIYNRAVRCFFLEANVEKMSNIFGLAAPEVSLHLTQCVTDLEFVQDNGSSMTVGISIFHSISLIVLPHHSKPDPLIEFYLLLPMEYDEFTHILCCTSETVMDLMNVS